jgi:hypothetical protein
VYKRSFGPDQDVVVIVTGKDVDWINAVKNEMIQTLNFLTNFEKEGIEDLDDEIDQVIVSKGEKKNFAEVERYGGGHHGGWGHGGRGRGWGGGWGGWGYPGMWGGGWGMGCG